MQIFYLILCEQQKNLAIIQEDTLTNGIHHTYIVPKVSQIESSGYILQYNKKNSYLFLTYPPSNIVIYDTIKKQMLLYTQTHGKNNYFINSFTLSESQDLLFFSSKTQRNIYCANFQEAIQQANFQKYSKLKLPKKVLINDLKCQPNEKKIVVACSDGFIRIWNYTSLSQLKSLNEPDNVQNHNTNNNENNNENRYFYTCLEFSNDGHKLLAGTNHGKIYILDSRHLGTKHLILAKIRISENGILSLQWMLYNGFFSFKNTYFLALTGEGILKLFNFQITGDLEQIKNIKNSQNKISAKINEISIIYQQKIDYKFQIQDNISMGFNKFLQVHQFSNLIAFKNIKMIEQFNQKNINCIEYNIKLIHLYDKMSDKIDFPQCSPQHTHSFEQLIPSQNKEILFQSQNFYIENLDIKLFSAAMNLIRTVGTLKQIILSDDILFFGLDTRPISLEYTNKIKFLLLYKLDNNFRATTFNINLKGEKEAEIEHFVELFCTQAVFLGNPKYQNPPVYYLMNNNQSFQIEFQQDYLDEQLKIHFLDKQNTHFFKDQLNVKIQKIYNTPLRDGFCIIYQNYGENILRFSKNRLPENHLCNMQILNDQNYTFKGDLDDNIIDIQWQNLNQDDKKQIGAIICLNKIYFINQNLEKIKILKLCQIQNSNNLINQGKWFGNALFFVNKTHINYACIDGTYNPCVSLDNFESKQIISFIMMDRIIIGSKNNLKKKIVKIIQNSKLNLFVLQNHQFVVFQYKQNKNRYKYQKIYIIKYKYKYILYLYIFIYFYYFILYFFQVIQLIRNILNKKQIQFLYKHQQKLQVVIKYHRNQYKNSYNLIYNIQVIYILIIVIINNSIRLQVYKQWNNYQKQKIQQKVYLQINKLKMKQMLQKQ
ncbi:hypothetical protein IMG5_105290 [Ichthyophthirius multifiliis]|uniref:Uncharacterized protein n=1 Tax=Ichthyophthirius multifiliis TaxID=5932 RepID=G0QT09_ICHMU|nr:hypothetical protein IMG5_105290 [Ichthyophthirius multifiliis]EGR31645.1 hypothetical protein IMG5_105290 [Ichthyophthirius multifiliis]|eukprot:XP_004035131.1 hypothetical protein IMG5_105290 [Ichthyophthirius multifiliis]